MSRPPDDPLYEFVPLRVRSHGSLLHGVVPPETLVERAIAAGYGALALTDRDNLYLAIRFWQAARANGLRPLLGAELCREDGVVLLLPLDRRGYAHLCELLTRRHLDPGFDLVEAVAARSSGLQVVVESVGLAASLLAAGVPPARGLLATGGSTSGRHDGGLWLGIRGLAEERPRLRDRFCASRALGLPVVATGDVVLLGPDDHAAHRAAVAAAAGELLARMPTAAFASPEARLGTPAEWVRRLRASCAAAGNPEAARAALLNNAALAERCRLELELGTPIFPQAPAGTPGGPGSGESGAAFLLRLGRTGIARRYAQGAARALQTRARQRLEWELGLIERLGYTDYFLLVANIVEFARAHGIPSVGRGSGASSIVSYALGITNVDPLRHGLYFERFLHPARRDCPDLDIDLCWRRRDEVIAHVYEAYGADRVGMISTHATLGARSAFRETAKVLGVSNARVNALARHVPRDLEPPYRDRLRAFPEARRVDWGEPPLPAALALAERLAGAPRHLSIHSGGVVIGDRPLTWYVPLERAAKGIVVTQFEMRAIEAIGLVKMDLLGNRALTTIGECAALVRERRGLEVDVAALPDPDPATARRLSSGETLNCFQLESPAMRNLLRMLRARTLEETIAAVALVRPGPAESGMKEAFCRRQRGLERPTYLHSRLEPALRATHGVMLYEEDVMCVAAALAGIPLHEGDELRRAIGAARTEEERAALERGFVHAALRAGVDEASARAVWRELLRFGAYAFCKAHAAGYGTLSYQSAYLKTHFPAEYAVGILNHHAGMYETWVHVEDLRRQGVVFLAPCAQRSVWDSVLEELEGRGGQALFAAVRVGLSRIFGLAQATGERILAARGTRAFASLADFTDRVRPTLPELESCILGGALDWTCRSRPSLLLEARTVAALPPVRRTVAPALLSPAGDELLPEARAPIALPELPEFALAERVTGERRATGLWFSAHPLEVWLPPERCSGATAAAALPDHLRRRVSVVGLPCARRHVETERGEPMLFLTLADRTGLAECVLFPDAYRAYAPETQAEVVRVEGTVEETLGSVTLSVSRVEALVVSSESRPPNEKMLIDARP